MRPKPPVNYLAGYAPELIAQVRALIAEQRLPELLRRRYPQRHAIRTDRALYDYVVALKERHLRHAGPLNRVAFDSTLHLTRNALGLHTAKSQPHGAKLKAKREIRISTLFRDGPPEFLRMIVVHELAHTKEPEHDKAFYQLCCHIEPDYHRLEFDLRCYLMWLEASGEALWGQVMPAATV